MPTFRPVRIVDVIPETADARSLVLDAGFDYRPGQYLTVRTPAGARCYSLSSAPGVDAAPKVTVKRVPGGQVSNWICDHVRTGDVLDMTGPAGTFTPDSPDDDLLLLAGGSGITPIMGIIKSMRGGARSLIYANRDVDSIIFRDELDRLLPVTHWLDSERGVPTADALRELLTAYPDRLAFVCGPEAFVAVAEKALQLAGVPASRIRVERFELESAGSRAMADPAGSRAADAPAGSRAAVAPADSRAVVYSAGSRAAVAEVELDGRTHVLPWAPGKRLLDVIIDAGLNPPYSCRQGQCGACACRLLSGEVTLVNNEILEEEDFAEGYILACQAVPLTDSVTVTYQ
ncbi:3-ketosteroid-9-alpha-monooxygenase, ferredoxin reductase component [Actinoplanes lobatus]|uniref:3-ketosteroid 9alpha-monooxygenase subunit B n=1 Tax=Actinoplanes lobatus TaxID=113568 RepID=A0A7W7HQQ2_9ACTN|nr:ferredoxin--NADP reductase [Actinoplanes lobatus]MBB4754956.1 3-ketosteroid 9alpha-monooxygenase subunit B [Actinoplanes lobatus]GGN82877.1 3-ketosteroid-9-alpha-monooxygenase, ferredoxin reductase component [Actinoplanes lobatus]GIE40725.1 3-ketosteroid-9-alpha-monooxygenase, ferredoxin reductase component [Actinoplanes lobatus]